MIKNSYEKSTDKLFQKVGNNKKISLNDACWLLCVEIGIMSRNYLLFKVWLKEEQNFTKKMTMTWPLWQGIFSVFQKEVINRPGFRDAKVEYAEYWYNKINNLNY